MFFFFTKSRRGVFIEGVMDYSFCPTDPAHLKVPFVDTSHLELKCVENVSLCWTSCFPRLSVSFSFANVVY